MDKSLGNDAEKSMSLREELRRSREHKSPGPSSASDPIDPMERYNSTCWSVYSKFAKTPSDELPMDSCQLGLPYDNLIYAVRRISSDPVALQNFQKETQRFQFQEGTIIYMCSASPSLFTPLLFCLVLSISLVSKSSASHNTVSTQVMQYRGLNSRNSSINCFWPPLKRVMIWRMTSTSPQRGKEYPVHTVSCFVRIEMHRY